MSAPREDQSADAGLRPPSPPSETRASNSSHELNPTAASVSCDRCRQRKSRCNRALPSCQQCEKSHVRCDYPHRRRPGFAAGHRQNLESKIEELEAEIRSLRSGKSGVRDLNPGRDTTPGVHIPTSSSIHTESDGCHPSNQRPPKPADWIFQGTYARSRNIKEGKPPLDLVISSVAIYFRYLHPWFPFLDIQRVMTELAAVREPSLLHYAIFGASLPFLYDSRLDQTMSDSFWKYTKRRVFVDAVEEPSYSSLEACTILTLDLSGMTNGPQVWGRLSVITKLATQLKTVTGRALRSSVAADEQDVSRPSSKQHARLFWAIYALDSYVSITTGQFPALMSHELKHFLPSRDLAWRGETRRDQRQPGRPSEEMSATPTSLFLYQLKLLDISRNFHELYLSYIALEEADHTQFARWLETFLNGSGAAGSWLQQLPDCLAIDIHSPVQRGLYHLSPTTIMLYAYSHALTIHLNGLVEFSGHRPFGEPALDFNEIQRAAHEECEQSVRAIVNIVSNFIDTISDQVGWPFAWAMWTAARYLVVEAFQHWQALAPEFHILLAGMQKTGKYWQISKKYWWILYRAKEALEGSSSNECPPRLLNAVVNLRVPTSDLEDQFRVDPLSLQETRSQQQSGIASRSRSVDGSEAAEVEMVNFGDFLDDSVFGSAEYWSDSWFAAPLFASSAYQQYPT